MGEPMGYKEYAYIASEATQLERLLSIMPKEDRNVQRIGLEERLRRAKKKIEGVKRPPVPREVRISFEGIRDGSIPADLAGPAIAAFAEATEAALRARTGGDAGKCLVTGGSTHPPGFDMQLQVAVEEGFLPWGETAAEKAMGALQDLAEAATEEDGQETARAAGECGPEAARKVSDALEMLLEHGVQASMNMKGRNVSMGDADGMRRALARLQELAGKEGIQTEQR